QPLRRADGRAGPLHDPRRPPQPSSPRRSPGGVRRHRDPLRPRVLARGPTLVGDAIMFVSALILAERTIYLARAVQRQDPVKLLLTQAVVGIVVFLLLSAIFEPAATRWTGRLAGAIAFQGFVVTGFNFIVNLW